MNSLNENEIVVLGGAWGSDRHKRKSWEAGTCQPVAPQGTTPYGRPTGFQKGNVLRNCQLSVQLNHFTTVDMKI